MWDRHTKAGREDGEKIILKARRNGVVDKWGQYGEVRALQTAREGANRERSLISNEPWGEAREQGQEGKRHSLSCNSKELSVSLNSGYTGGLCPC